MSKNIYLLLTPEQQRQLTEEFNRRTKRSLQKRGLSVGHSRMLNKQNIRKNIRLAAEVGAPSEVWVELQDTIHRMNREGLSNTETQKLLDYMKKRRTLGY